MSLKSLRNKLFPVEPEDTTGEEAYYDINLKENEDENCTNGSKMILLEPRAFSESQQIADHLKKRNSVVVNLKRVTSDQAKRIIDFLTGTIYAIGGDLKKIGQGIYLCTPKNVNVQGEITEDSKNTGRNNSDEIEL